MFSNTEHYSKIDYLKKNYTTIQYFGLGFVQIKLNSSERMHFWHPDFDRPMESIHNHRYNFKSTVLYGRLDAEEYMFNRSDSGDYEMFITDCSPMNEGTPIILGRGDVELTKLTSLVAGSEYWLHHDTLHRVSANYCVTLLFRNIPQKKSAQVVQKKDLPIECPFSHNLPENELWEIVDDCLRYDYA